MIKVVTNGFVPIPTDVMESVSNIAFSVYCGLSSMNRKGINNANWKDIAKASHVKAYVTVMKGIEELKSNGWLRAEKTGDTIEFEALYEQELPEIEVATVNRRTGEITPDSSEYVMQFQRKIRKKEAIRND